MKKLYILISELILPMSITVGDTNDFNTLFLSKQ